VPADLHSRPGYPIGDRFRATRAATACDHEVVVSHDAGWARAAAGSIEVGVRTRSMSDASGAPVVANGATVAAVVRFVLDYEATARVEDVARHFRLDVDDVDAALASYSRHLEQVRDTLEAGDR
jgi:hypothetical protein